MPGYRVVSEVSECICPGRAVGPAGPGPCAIATGKSSSPAFVISGVGSIDSWMTRIEVGGGSGVSVPLSRARGRGPGLAADVGAQRGELRLQALVAAVEVVHVADLGAAVRRERGDHHRRSGADVERAHRRGR